MSALLRGLGATLAPETGRIAGLPFVRVGPLRDGDGDDTPDEQPPLVIVPGLNDPLHSVADSRWFPRTVASYGRRYADARPVYYVSQPRDGHETIADIATAYGPAVEEIAARHARADRHGNPPALLGLSMGGFLAAEVAAACPAAVDRLVLGLAADRIDRDSGRATLERWDEYAVARRWRAIYREAAAVVAVGPQRAAMQAATSVYDLVRSPRAPEAFRRAIAACLSYDGGDALGRVAEADVPTLVVGGDDDPFFTDGGFDRAAERADGRRVRLRGAAHDAVLNGDGFERAVRRFLSGAGA